MNDSELSREPHENVVQRGGKNRCVSFQSLTLLFEHIEERLLMAHIKVTDARLHGSLHARLKKAYRDYQDGEHTYNLWGFSG